MLSAEGLEVKMSQMLQKGDNAGVQETIIHISDYLQSSITKADGPRLGQAIKASRENI